MCESWNTSEYKNNTNVKNCMVSILLSHPSRAKRCRGSHI